MSINPESLAAWSISTTKAGKLKKVTEYIDMTTGEIIPADTIQMPVLDLRGKQAKKDAVLDKLRPEVREFACFVLDFHNKRRGITPGINTLCHWYAALTGKQSQHVRRYIPKLEAAGILAGENLLGRLFQHTGWTVMYHMGEETRAYAKFVTSYMTGLRGPLRRRAAWDSSNYAAAQRLCGGTVPEWLDDAEPTANLMTHEIYCGLMRRVGLPISHTPHEVACAHAGNEPVEPLRVQGVSIRVRIKGMSAEDVGTLVSGYFRAHQRSRLDDAYA